jgi:hypothetical protein
VKRLTFGCELQTDELQELFADPVVLDALVDLGAGVSLGLLDLSAGRAAVVRELNRAGIPVIAWLLLPREQGYWFNADNAPQATARYAEFKAWTAAHGLRWAGIGVDIEPDFAEMQQLLGGDRWRLLPKLLCRAFDGERVRRAQANYAALLAQMRTDGYRVESYQFPFIADERKAGSTLLQRTFGLVDVQADREVLMLYTSFTPGIGPALLWSYAPDAQGIAVGITGSGAEPEGLAEPLSWEQLARDLRLAGRWRDEVFVYSLEGCVHQGFLAQLRGFDWGQVITPPLNAARGLMGLRKGLQAVLWASAHPTLVVVGLLGLAWLLGRPPRSGRDRRSRSLGRRS